MFMTDRCEEKISLCSTCGSDAGFDLMSRDGMKIVSCKSCLAPREKNLPASTGERFLPWLEDAKIHYEHLHRYRLAQELAEGKTVLDLASGEGYGSCLLSRRALAVVGVDIDRDAVDHASRKYVRENLRFIEGTITNPPLKDNELFDLIVCFEALEHIEDQELLFLKTKKHLKPGGIFIVSTPDKGEYSDAAGFSNPYHVKELYFDEFQELLSSHFKHSAVFGQKLSTGSILYPVSRQTQTAHDWYIDEDTEKGGYRFTSKAKFRPEYFVALASDQPLDEILVSASFCLYDVSCSLYEQKLTSDKKLTDYYLLTQSDKKETAALLEDQNSMISGHQKTILEKDEIIKGLTERLDQVLGSKAWRAAELFRKIFLKDRFGK